MRKVSLLTGILLCLTPVCEAAAQEHSQHRSAQGDDFGTVHFANSCAESTAGEFDRAVAILHSFEFGQAITSFNNVLAVDPDCAMAYWGIALSRWLNPFLASARGAAELAAGAEAVQKAKVVASHASKRERAYIDAVAQLYADYATVPQNLRISRYERAMASVVAAFPDDMEARIFYAVSLTASEPPTDKAYGNRLMAAGILEPLFAIHPDHPGLAHYLIHSYDVPALADRAGIAATRYSEIAPSASHALHMPSHTFTRVGLWAQSVATNRRSMEVSSRTKTHNEGWHAADYAVYALLQMGQDSATLALREEMERATPSAGGVEGAAPSAVGVFARAAIPARIAVERRDWQAAAALQPRSTAFPWAEAMTHFARALGAAHTGNVTSARKSIDSLSSIRERLVGLNEMFWAQHVSIQQLAAQGWVDYTEGRRHDALTSMREAARLEDETEKSAVSPGAIVPARELLADMYFSMGRFAEALVEYQSELKKDPNRFRGLYGAMRAADALGDRAAVAKYRSALRELTANADRPGRRELRLVRRP